MPMSTAPQSKLTRSTLGSLKQKVNGWKAAIVPPSRDKLRGWLAQSAATTRETAMRSWHAISKSGKL